VDTKKRWDFSEHDEGPRLWWSWQLVASDGKIEKTSEQFLTYGEAVADAIRKGFRPRDDDWSVDSKHGMARFERATTKVRLAQATGTKPVSITSRTSLYRK
jgi:hypothetical protein